MTTLIRYSLRAVTTASLTVAVIAIIWWSWLIVGLSVALAMVAVIVRGAMDYGRKQSAFVQSLPPAKLRPTPGWDRREC